MADQQPKSKKEKRVIPIRQAGTMVERPDERPSKLLFDEVARQSEAEANQDQTQTRPRPDPYQDQTQPILPHKQQNSKKTSPNAPVRDFNKRANSIDRDALPLGAFPGASKKIYDALYIRTRGAVQPVRTIQATRKDLMSWSGVQNIKTINAHLKRLKDSRLLSVTNFVGEQSGSIYEVFLPDEINLIFDPDQTQTTRTRPEPGPDPDQYQKMDLDQYQKMVWVGSGKPLENKGTYDDAKTFFKTLKLNDDDAPVVVAFEKLNEAARAATGKDLTSKDGEAFLEIIELLIDETTIARTRTKSISVYLKFAAENLRRRLFKKNAPQAERPKSFEPGKIENVSTEFGDELVAEPLGEKREFVLENLRRTAEINGSEAIEVYRENYTPEDWDWLTKELSGKQPSETLEENKIE